MPKTSAISEFRQNMSVVFSRAVQQHQPIFVQRGGREFGSLFGLDELERLLAAYEFHPEVFFEADGVDIWLPELELYGRGTSFEEAQADLADEVREYVEEYLDSGDEYLRAPNREGHFPFVLKAAVAELRATLPQTLFAYPRTPTAPRSSWESVFGALRDSSDVPSRHVLLSVADEDWPSIGEFLKGRERCRFVEVSQASSAEARTTYAEEVPPFFGARPANQAD